jgi:hypothetical protein
VTNNNDSGVANSNDLGIVDNNMSNNHHVVTEINNIAAGNVARSSSNLLEPTPNKDWVTALDHLKKKQHVTPVNMTGVTIGHTRNLPINNNNSADDEFNKLMKMQFAQQQIEAQQCHLENEQRYAEED